MANKYSTPAFLVLLFYLLFVVPFGSQGHKTKEEEPRPGGVFHLKSLANSYRTELDPAKAGSYIFISEQIFDGLVKLDKNFNIVPSLAEYWEISLDGRTYTFYIRKDAKFHDGSKLTAADVKFSFERILAKNTHSPYYEIFLSKVVGADAFRQGESPEVIGFKVLDTYKLEIHWKKPFVSALYLLSMHFCKILPKQHLEDQGEKFFLKPIGTGPFKFKCFIRDSKGMPVGTRLTRNESYFLGKPYLDGVEFCPHFSLDNFIDAEIESFPVLSDRFLSPDYQIFQDGSLSLFLLGMSCHIAPLNSVLVRQAIRHAVDKDEIVNKAQESRYSRKAIHNFIPSKLPGFFPLDEEKAYDQTEARRLLWEAGYKSGDSFPILTLAIEGPKSETKIQIFREVKKQLAELGIQLRLKYCDNLQELKESENPYLVLQGKLMDMPDPEDIIRPLFSSESDFNLLGYRNSDLDTLLIQAEIESSWTKRTNLFHRIEQLLFSDMPAIPLFTQQNQVAMQSYVRGVEPHPLGFYYLEARKIWLDKR